MAKKIENDALFDEENAKASAPAQQNTNGKKKVVVVNVPKRKKLLRTPSHIIRITLIWCFLLVLFLLTYPFLEVRFYITKDLSVSPYAEDAYRVLAEQEDIDKAAEKLQKALDSLVEVPKTEDHISAESEQKPESAAESSAAVPPLPILKPLLSPAGSGIWTRSTITGHIPSKKAFRKKSSPR